MTSRIDPDQDREAVAAILDGDRERFAEIVERYQDRLVNFLARMLRNLDEAHDVAQEAFLKTYRALDTYDPSYRFSTWIFRIARNAAIDRLRRRRMQTVSLTRPDPEGGDDRHWELPGEDATPYEDARQQERRRTVLDAVAELPWEYRELIVLRHYAELAYREIAELKEMPLGTVKNKLYRARRMLEEQLDREWME